MSYNLRLKTFNRDVSHRFCSRLTYWITIVGNKYFCQRLHRMSTLGHSAGGSQSTGSKKRKRQGCEDSDTEQVRKFFNDIYEGDGIMNNDPGVNRVIATIMAIDAKLKKQNHDLQAADARCNAKREEDKTELRTEHQNAINQLRTEHQNDINQLHTELTTHKTRVETVTNTLARYQEREEDLDALVRESKERKALMKFRHVISVFRKLVCKELHTEWKIFHPLLEDEDEETMNGLQDVLRNTFGMSMEDWDTLTKTSRMGSKVAHPTFDNEDEISLLLKQLPDEVSNEDRCLLRNLTSRLINEWKVRDKIIK